MDLTKLSEPFPADDIEWRVAQSGVNTNGTFCMVIAYVTARAIQARLDEVCGPAGWRLEEPRIIEFTPGKTAFACGLSIKIDDEWVTKWDVAEPTAERGEMVGTSAKGGWSGAIKRAGSQWGIGRYLYHLEAVFADTAEKKGQNSSGKRWNYAKLPQKHGGGVYYWLTPNMPGWALPDEPGTEIARAELDDLKRQWRTKFAPKEKNRAALTEGFARFVSATVGEFPASDHTCWTIDALERCVKRIEETTDPGGVSPDVPFKE